MDWLNYHHLLYFWTVAREGSVARACAVLHLAQPTVSGQLRALERSLGIKLFARAGRGLALTDAGRVVYRYADDIFSLGRELREVLRERPSNRPLRFAVGVADALPKLIVHRLLEPALHLAEPVHLICHEGKVEQMLALLALHQVDLVLADLPASAGVKVKAFNHFLGETPVSIFGTSALVAIYKGGFPSALDGAPFLLPTDNAPLRRSLDGWFESIGVRPTVRAEFADSALLKAFGRIGTGLFAAPTVVEKEICRQYHVEVLARIEVRERFYAISVERKLKHPAVVAIAQAAQKRLFRLRDSTD